MVRHRSVCENVSVAPQTLAGAQQAAWGLESTCSLERDPHRQAVADDCQAGIWSPFFKRSCKSGYYCLKSPYHLKVASVTKITA